MTLEIIRKNLWKEDQEAEMQSPADLIADKIIADPFNLAQEITDLQKRFLKIISLGFQSHFSNLLPWGFNLWSYAGSWD